MDQDLKKILKKGTTTVGVVCKDGVVLAADKRVSAGYLIATKKIDKIHRITDDIAVTISGSLSDAQLTIKLIQAELRLKKIRTGKDIGVKEATNLVAGIVYSNLRKMSMIPSIVGMLLGGRDEKGFKLYELGIDGSIVESEDFVSNGSGSPLAYGVLETLHKEGISVQEGIKLAMRAVHAAIRRDLPTGDGIDVVVIDNKGFRRLPTKKIVETLQ